MRQLASIAALSSALAISTDASRRDLTAKAYNDITKLTRPQIDALVNETLKRN